MTAFFGVQKGVKVATIVDCKCLFHHIMMIKHHDMMLYHHMLIIYFSQKQVNKLKHMTVFKLINPISGQFEIVAMNVKRYLMINEMVFFV